MNSVLKNKIGATTFMLLLLVQVFTIVALFPVPTVSAVDVPATVNGDWIVTGTESYDGGTCTLTGNLIIEQGAQLTFNNVTLIMNVASDGQYGIMVNGTFDLYDTRIQSINWAIKYRFEYTALSNGELVNCNLTEMYEFGLLLVTPFAEVRHCEISNSTIGIFIDGVSPLVANNTIFNNELDGIFCYDRSYAKIYDNVIEGNMVVGKGTPNWGGGITIMYSSPRVVNNVLSDNGNSGIHILGSLVTITNCTLSQPSAVDIRIDGNFSTTAVNPVVHTYSTEFESWRFNDLGFNWPIEFYAHWYSHVNVTWETDGEPVDGRLDIFGTEGYELERNVELGSDGKIRWLPVTEFHASTSGSGTPDIDTYTPLLFVGKGWRGGHLLRGNQSLDVESDVWVDIVIDDIPPTLDMEWPPDEHITNLTEIPFSGHTEPDSKVKIKGKFATVDSNGYFNTSVKLVEGRNKILVNVSDDAGNPLHEFINVTRDTIAPLVEITSPENNSLLNVTDVLISGTTEPNVTLMVHNTLATVDESGNFNVTVTLNQFDNLVVAEATDAAGNVGTDSIVVNVDSIEPHLVIATPEHNSLLNDPVVTVKGSTELGARVWIGDVEAQLTGGLFTVTITLENEGKNELVVSATDLAGNNNSEILVLFLDTLPPVVNWTHPPVGFSTNGNSVEVYGTTEVDATVWVDGDEVDLKNGNFSTTVKVEMGQNEIVLEVEDLASNLLEIRRNVLVERTPPILTILEPKDGQVYKRGDTEAKIKGSTEKNAKVVVNDVQILVVNGDFETFVTLQEGENTVKIQAIDNATNKKTVILTLILDTIVDYTISAPNQGLSTKDKKVIASGSLNENGTVTVSGIKADLAPDGSFSVEVPLERGENSVTFVFKDENGNEESITRTVTCTAAKVEEFPMGLVLGVVAIIVVVVVLILLFTKFKAPLMRKVKGEPEPAPVVEEPPPPDFSNIQDADTPGTQPGDLPPPPPGQPPSPPPGQQPPPPPPPAVPPQ